MSNPHQVLTGKMASLLDSGEFSDLTVKCGDETFAVHRMILLPASKVFAAACSGGFKVRPPLFTIQDLLCAQ